MSPSPAPLPAASLGRRLAALLYESLLVVGVLSVAFLLPHMLIGLGANTVVPGFLLWLHLFLVLGIYFVASWHHYGRTLAMQAWRLRLVDAAGHPPALGRLVFRYLLSWPSLLAGGVGLIWALFDRERLFLHERLSGTRLIVVPPNTKARLPPSGT